MVAHPDDCVIFASPYILGHPEHAWTIGYLTHTECSPRGKELQEFWRQYDIDCVFLGFEDHWHDQEQQQFTRWDASVASEAVANLAKKFDLVLTHDADGDYGHIHHVLVHRAVAHQGKIVTFARPGTGNLRFPIDRASIDLEKLPQHRGLIEEIWLDQQYNYYQETFL
jgi:LmbE family N-acetylglucosaminyl deacetylase